MLSRYEPSIDSPFNEFVGLLDQIIGVQGAKTTVKEIMKEKVLYHSQEAL